jgi:hypothetical protein
MLLYLWGRLCGGSTAHLQHEMSKSSGSGRTRRVLTTGWLCLDRCTLRHLMVVCISKLHRLRICCVWHFNLLVSVVCQLSPPFYTCWYWSWSGGKFSWLIILWLNIQLWLYLYVQEELVAERLSFVGNVEAKCCRPQTFAGDREVQTVVTWRLMTGQDGRKAWLRIQQVKQLCGDYVEK